MTKDGRYERIPQGPAEEILERILEFRDRYDRYERPDDVNYLLSLFPRVRLREEYVLDYVLTNAGDAVQRILPFARPASGEGDLLLAEGVGDEQYDPVEALYRHLEYESEPQGLFEYAFFVIELLSTRASWHAAEWLSSTPVFTEERFEKLVDEAEKVDDLWAPDWYGPETALDCQGGAVRFLVYTEMGWKRIYYLDIEVDARGCIDQKAGHIVADFGQGLIF